MFASPRVASRPRDRRVSRLLVTVSLAALLAACSSTRHPSGPQVFAWLSAEPAPPPAAPVELEDDGLPPQSPPPVRSHAEPDDPSEPWSPNYGRTLAAIDPAVRAEPSPAGARVADGTWMLPTDADESHGLPRPMSPEEASAQEVPAPRSAPSRSYRKLPFGGCAGGPGGWRCGR